MSGWTTPPHDAVPPSPGVAPPPAVGMHNDPDAERAAAETRAEAEKRKKPKAAKSRSSQGPKTGRSHGHRDGGGEDAEAAQYVPTADLRRDVERTRERLNQDVVDLRGKFGLGREDGDGNRMVSGPFRQVRRHPFAAAVVAAGAASAALISLKLLRDRRGNGTGGRVKVAVGSGGKAARRRFLGAKDTVVRAAGRRPRRARAKSRCSPPW